jgi:hypothetical protein
MIETCARCRETLLSDDVVVWAVELIPVHTFGDPLAGVAKGRHAFFHEHCFGNGLPAWEANRSARLREIRPAAK